MLQNCKGDVFDMPVIFISQESTEYIQCYFCFALHFFCISFCYHYSTALLASQNLCSLVSRGDTYQSLEWILLDCHSNLLEMLQETNPGNTSWIAQRCQQVTALIRCSSLPQSIEILQLQEKVLFNNNRQFSLQRFVIRKGISKRSLFFYKVCRGYMFKL